MEFETHFIHDIFSITQHLRRFTSSHAASNFQSCLYESQELSNITFQSFIIGFPSLFPKVVGKL